MSRSDEIETMSPSRNASAMGRRCGSSGELAAPVDLEHTVDEFIIKRLEIGIGTGLVKPAEHSRGCRAEPP